MENVPEYIPDARPPGFTKIEGFDGAIPEIGEMVSHGTLAQAVQLRVPTPVLAMEMLCVGGVAPALAGTLESK